MDLIIDACRPGLRERPLAQGPPATPAEVDALLPALRRTGIAARSIDGRRIPACDLTPFSLGERARSLNSRLGPGAGCPRRRPTASTACCKPAAGQRERRPADPLGPHDEAAACALCRRAV